jgi:hypothetical protein
MGSKKIPYGEVISGRVTAEDKYLMKKYDVNVRDAVKWYLHHIITDSKRIELEKEKLKEEIYNLKMDLIVAEMELENLEKEAVKNG